MKDHRIASLLKEQLKEFDKEIEAEKNINANFNVGEIISFRLVKSQRPVMAHVSVETKYSATRSLPHRIVKIIDKILIVKPLWSRGPEARIPIAQARKICECIPALLRKAAADLFPLAPRELLLKNLFRFFHN